MRLVALLCGLAVAAGCAQTPRVNVDPETGNVDIDMQRPGTGETWNATLAATGDMAVSGTVRAHVMDDMTHATVELAGGTEGSAFPWHIHEGRCGDDGPVVGPATAYPLLRPDAAGRASAAAHLSNVELNEARRYYVNVHASEAEMGTIVACGNLDD